MAVAEALDSSFLSCLADMVCLGFFFMLRPGEYTATPSDSTPFWIQDVKFHLGRRKLPPTAPLQHLLNSTFATLEFTTQKNGVKGKVIGHGCTRDPLLCPVQALARQVIHLRSNNFDNSK